MQALLSPHSTTALIFQSQAVYLLDGGNALCPLSAAAVGEWLSAHGELRWHSADNVAEMEQALSLYSRRREALDMALISMDGNLSLQLRNKAQQELERLLEDHAVAIWLSDIFHVRPLVAEAEIETALSQAREGKRLRVLNCLEEVVRNQDAIARSWIAWNAIPEKLLHPAGGRQAVLDFAMDKGLFTNAIRLLAKNQIGDAKYEALTCLKGMVGYRQIVEAWFLCLAVVKPVRTVKKSEVAPEDNDWERKTERKKIQSRSYDRKEYKRKVDEQKIQIIRLIRSRQWGQASQAVDGLVDLQYRHGGGNYAAKSLCDLAVEAKSLGNHSLQLELTERAVGQNPKDGWAWAQQGDALLNNGRLDDALLAFENSVAFGVFIAGKVGRAQVFKSKGSYDDALAAYDEVIIENPENVVAKNGRAEVLKAMGRFPEALQAFEEVTKTHPENVVAKNGRAEVLKAMGRFPEALQAFEEVTKTHPENLVAKNGRAEVLKALGRYPEALQAFEDVTKDHPEDVFAKNGRAEVLKAMGRHPEALQAFEDVTKDHPKDVFEKKMAGPRC
ncbi:MAG: tetratricopeptide repeat protein [Proteobacteria bacterium]|nr:tetratricopeptide repeat protein [Pseudomonadota bacterium]